MRWLLGLVFLILAGCQGGNFSNLSQLNVGVTPSLVALERRENNGDTEIFFNPVDVWEANRASAPTKEYEVEGKKLYFSLREKKGFFDKAWVRVGLFWHSRLDKKVFLPIVILEKSTDIRKVEVFTDSTQSLLGKAKSFQFTPEKGTFGKEMSSGSFEMKIPILRAIVESKNAYMVINTEKGNLRVDLAAAQDHSPSALKNSIKYRFSEFLTEAKL